MCFNEMHLLLALLPCTLVATATAVAAQTRPGCQNVCGNVTIPYRLGTSESCYRDKTFLITCNTTSESDHPTAYYSKGNIKVLSISLSGELRVLVDVTKACYAANDFDVFNGSDIGQYGWMRLSKFAISNANNKFTVVGCDTFAYIQDYWGSRFSTGCMLTCNNITDMKNGSCSGVGCCQTSFPNAIMGYNFSLGSYHQHKYVWGFNRCSYAFLVEDGSFNFSSQDLLNLRNRTEFPIVLNWAIEKKTCTEAMKKRSNYACMENSMCEPSESGLGYLCKCKPGFQGNPYLSGSNGCQDIDECMRATHNCISEQNCRNTDGSFECFCLGGQSGNGTKEGGCLPKQRQYLFTKVAIGLSSSLGSIILLLVVWWLYKIVRRRAKMKRKEKFFKQNGGLLLQERLSSGEVNIDKTMLFSFKDLEKATDHFNVNRVLGKGGQGTVYKGMLVDGKIVAIKKFKVRGKVEEFINEFVILSQINDRNVVKLLGCFLETEVPLLVYEFIPNGNLFQYLHEQNEDLPTTWNMRLRIASEVAGALFYLHSAASQPIYHRDVKSTNILLDEKYRAKVADFGTSRMISIEDTHLTTQVQGTFGYLDPEYFHTSQFTEKSDVYSLGVVLVELLTGQKPISSIRPEEAKSLASYFIICLEEDRLFEIIDSRVVKEGDKEHIMAVAHLAKRCLSLNGKKRPTMKEVIMELDNAQPNLEKICLAAIEYQPWAADIITSTGPVLNNTTSSSSEATPFVSID